MGDFRILGMQLIGSIYLLHPLLDNLLRRVHSVIGPIVHGEGRGVIHWLH